MAIVHRAAPCRNVPVTFTLDCSMRSQIDHALRSAYSVSEGKLLLVNAALAVFVAISNGGALAIATAQAAPELSEIRAQAAISLPLSALVLVCTIAAVAGWLRRDRALAIHSVALCLSAVALMLWGANLLFAGAPEGRFVWMPGILTAWVTYASVLGVRFLVHDRSATYSLPAYGMLAAVIIDIGVLARVL